MGDQFTVIALLWFMLELRDSGTALGIVFLCFRLPGIITSPLFGALLDRHQPRLVMSADNAARALIIGAIPILHWVGWLQISTAFTLALLAGALTPATSVGVRVLMPYLVSDSELESSNALLSVSGQLSYLAGPALAGLLMGAFDGPPVLLIDAATFVLMAVLLYSLRDISRRPRAEGATGARGWFGFAALVQFRAVGIVTVLSLVFFFAYGPLQPALPTYSRTSLGAGASGYGLMWSAFGLGALLGLLLIPVVRRLSRPGVTLAMIAMG